MDDFITCLVDDDLSVLGDAPDDMLHETWLLILQEFNELRGGDGQEDEAFTLSRDIRRWRNHLFLVEQCVKFLAYQYSEKIADSLESMGYSFCPEVKEPAAYVDDLTRIVSESKSKYVLLQQLIKQLDELNHKNAATEKITRQYFEGMLVAIEEVQHVSYSLDAITVSKYVSLEKKYWKHI